MDTIDINENHYTGEPMNTVLLSEQATKTVGMALRVELARLAIHIQHFYKTDNLAMLHYFENRAATIEEAIEQLDSWGVEAAYETVLRG